MKQKKQKKKEKDNGEKYLERKRDKYFGDSNKIFEYVYIYIYILKKICIYTFKIGQCKTMGASKTHPYSRHLFKIEIIHTRQ